MRTKICVTKEDISDGIPLSAAYCPVAKAIQRVFEDNTCRVYHAIMYAERTFTVTPRSVRKFVRKFDAGKSVEPFCFIYKGKEK